MRRRTSAALLFLLPALACAEAPPVDSLFVSGMAGVNAFGDDRQLERDINGSLGLAYRFSSALAVEVAGGRTTAEAKPAGAPDMDVDTIGLAALWFPLPGATWEGYLSANAGQQRFSWSGGGEDDETLVGVGGGVFRALGGPFLLRLEARAAYSTDHEDVDFLALAGISIAFGGDAFPVDFE